MIFSAEYSDNLGTSVEFLRKGALVVDLHPYGVEGQTQSTKSRKLETLEKRRLKSVFGKVPLEENEPLLRGI